MKNSDSKSNGRAKNAYIIIGLILFLSVVAWVTSAGNRDRLQSVSRAGQNGVQQQEMRYAPAADASH